ncbi:MAG: (2Fe-2S) ferredoxin domain-containing protein [Rhodospirillaceae bacterium]|jgi:(2Fe-2S) ferredoxin|nr:(2Fe-2S) ferredoxin domain-containing protein [Rhodospirillaceae bacterium]MBT7488269.1 (2Fe-2S) ferredoxin domain-containing protein [Rhodospirillales bacterium]MBT4701388.1 (2Fe-2S) ferredoxin domain-containing protein [Rhodospirillaceae bacterium]MBT5036216.1 (2Fe-2S) ferredoxin domain-containing protein [Rhodospirillaceae bacterium]MBT6220720.1 (2Fe-2S) ferredoxin domain-containing protein [Rhodospirillaceae bacterium]
MTDNNATSADLFYRCHVFCCTNERPEKHPRGSCSRRDSVKLRNYMKARAKEMGLRGVRINSAGCLDRCELGPTMVVYPEGIWYRCETNEDIDQVLTQHVQNGEPVKHLMLDVDE